jgi:hypothetical protein
MAEAGRFSATSECVGGRHRSGDCRNQHGGRRPLYELLRGADRGTSTARVRGAGAA